MIIGLPESKEAIEVFVIDRHQLVIDGIRSVMDINTTRIKVVGNANSSKEAITKLKITSAKIIILELILTDTCGVSFCKLLKVKFPDKKIIVFTGELRTEILYNVWENGVEAILMKYVKPADLVSTIHRVFSGHRIIGQMVPYGEFFHMKKQKSVAVTQSEQKVLKALAMGFSKEEAGRVLGSNTYVVNFHCNNLLHKFNKEKLYQVIEKAKKEGLLAFEI